MSTVNWYSCFLFKPFLTRAFNVDDNSGLSLFLPLDFKYLRSILAYRYNSLSPLSLGVPPLSLQCPRYALLQISDPLIEYKPGHRRMCLGRLCHAGVSKRYSTYNSEPELLTCVPIDFVIEGQRVKVTVSYIDGLVCFGD